MLLRYFYDQALAHASYLVGCQRANEALIVDPGRDVEGYLAVARAEGLRITAVAETHIHADYVSGARELADRVAAKLYLSDMGPADWKYQFAADYPCQLVRAGDRFGIGKIVLETLHTPGHTPESVSFLLTDQGGGADRPMGIFTGDFVFVGAVGRPDLLEEAAGVAGSAAAGAHDLYRSVRQFLQLPDFLQVWPAHGAGSACGKGLGAVPSSTVGYEKLFNPALQIDDEQAFVDYILADQPEAPRYFAVMKRVNKLGPKLFRELPEPVELPPGDAPRLAGELTLIDLAPAARFAAAHVPGTLNIPMGLLAQWAGWLVDVERPLALIAAPQQHAEATRILRKIGVDQLVGFLDRGAVEQVGVASQSYPSVAPAELASQVAEGSLPLLDVRSAGEWAEGRIPGAQHAFLGRLADRAAEFAGRRVAVQCQLGGRSAIAASLLQAHGADVVNMAGGYAAWQAAGLPLQA